MFHIWKQTTHQVDAELMIADRQKFTFAKYRKAEKQHIVVFLIDVLTISVKKS